MISSRAVIVWFLIATAGPAAGQPVGRGAQDLYDSGRKLMASGKITEACTDFEESHRLDPAVTTLIALAACREKLGLLANARALLREVERQTGAAKDSVTMRLHQIARTRADKLEARVSRLTIRVTETVAVDSLEILIDARRLPVSEWNQALPIDGGTYTVTARAEGVSEWSMRVTLASEGDAQTIEVPDLRPRPPPVEPSIAPPISGLPVGSSTHAFGMQGPQEGARPRRSLVPLVVGAGSVVVLGGALGISLWGDATYDRAKAEMADQARRDSLYESANRKRHAAQGLAVAGVSGAAVAVWLYVRQRGRRDDLSARATGWRLTPSASGIGVTGQF